MNRDDILKAASEKLGSTPDDLKNNMKKGNIEGYLKNLKPEDAQRVQSVLNNKEEAAKILNTPQAQKLIKQLLGEKK